MKDSNGSRILYQNGKYDVRAERFGKDQSAGFGVYEAGITHAVRVGIVGFSGGEGYQRAKDECDRRASAAKTQPGGSFSVDCSDLTS